MTDAQWTIGSLLRWTTDYLRQHGSITPRLDAEVLLAEVHGCQRINLYIAYEELASDETRVAYRELVRRRAEGTPVAYLVGRREFYSHQFRVTPDVLIPRPETEFVLVALLDLVKQLEGRPIEVVDVGTGSGILAICAALHIPDCRVTAIDISPASLHVAQTNAASQKVEDRVEFVEGNLLAALDPDQIVDFIVSNPPYVSEVEWESLAPNIREHEPRQALVAGETGTEVIAQLIQQAPAHLRLGGWLVFEISPMILDQVENLFVDAPGLGPTRIVKDLAHHPRVVLTQRVEN